MSRRDFERLLRGEIDTGVYVAAVIAETRRSEARRHPVRFAYTCARTLVLGSLAYLVEALWVRRPE